MAGKATNIKWHPRLVHAADRNRLNGHKGCVVWLTGLPSSGKSTIAVEAERLLFERKVRCYVLDGDNVRHGLNNNLGFSPEDRTENIRRIGEVAKLFVDAGMVVITSFISPYRADRDAARAIMGEGEFLEVLVKADVETCKARDPKGLYKKALAGEIKDFTGVSAPYEEPLSPELVLDTTALEVGEEVQKLIECLVQRGVVPSKAIA